MAATGECVTDNHDETDQHSWAAGDGYVQCRTCGLDVDGDTYDEELYPPECEPLICNSLENPDRNHYLIFSFRGGVCHHCDAVPPYQVTNVKTSDSAGISRQSATLIVPDATVKSATAALADWASKLTVDYVQAETIRSAGAATYVCNLLLAADDRTAQVLMGGGERVRLNCPDPSGQ